MVKKKGQKGGEKRVRIMSKLPSLPPFKIETVYNSSRLKWDNFESFQISEDNDTKNRFSQMN